MLLSFDKRIRSTISFVGLFLFIFLLQNPGALASSSIETSQVNTFVRLVVRFAIKDQAKAHADSISSAIMTESLKYEFDPIMLISIIETESGFSIKRRGKAGEIGLMQIKPSTAEWIAKRNGLPWNGEKDLEDPIKNIQLGTAYLHFLKKEFSPEVHLYLSAYNMGTYKLRKAIKNQILPKQYASRVLRSYREFYARIAHVAVPISI